MADFVDINIIVDPNQLADLAVANLTSALQTQGFLGYTPADGNFEIILITTLALLAAAVAQIAAQMPAAAFRAFGTKLANIPYQTGAAATIVTTWTLTDTLGHTIPAGTGVVVGGYGFTVAAPLTIGTGQSTATVTLTAADIGTVYNGLSGGASLVDAISWVVSVTVNSASSGGADREDDGSYQNRLSGELALQAPRPITASDYQTFVLSVPSSVVPTGVVVGRATSIDGYNGSTNTFIGVLTNTSTTVTGVSSFTGVTVNSRITGANIPANTFVVSINTGASTLVMSAAATGSATESIVSIESYNNSRTVTTFVTDAQGIALSNSAMADIAAWLSTYREANFLTFVAPPTTSLIYVNYQIHPLPGYDPTATITAAEAAILNYINPATWGGPQTQATQKIQWLNITQGFNILRYRKLIGIIENVPGVDYLTPGSTGLTIGFTASPTGTVDLVLPGPAPLPTCTTSTVIGSLA